MLKDTNKNKILEGNWRILCQVLLEVDGMNRNFKNEEIKLLKKCINKTKFQELGLKNSQFKTHFSKMTTSTLN